MMCNGDNDEEDMIGYDDHSLYLPAMYFSLPTAF